MVIVAIAWRRLVPWLRTFAVAAATLAVLYLLARWFMPAPPVLDRPSPGTPLLAASEGAATTTAENFL